jgi:hypothetical protein
MSDFQRGVSEEDEDRLPWLEPVDDYDEGAGISMARLIGAVVVGLVALGLVIGGIFWLRNRDNAGGDGTLIAAPEGPVKERPEEKGGMKVEGTGDVAYGASVGKDVNSTIDLSALPEEPVSGTPSATTPAPASAKPSPQPANSQTATIQQGPAAKPAPPSARQAPVPPVGGAAPVGGAIQLGAFSSQALANKAWSSLAKRFGFLAGLDHSVNGVPVGGKTLYRLRANAGGQAATLCAKLKVAGEACTIVS